MRETGRSGVAAYLKKRVLGAGGFIRKVAFPGQRGAPDYLVGFGVKNKTVKVVGRVFVETKRPVGGVLKPYQKREHKRLKVGTGVSTKVISSKDEVDMFIKRYFG